MEELRTKCLEKIEGEHKTYKEHFRACGMDILGPDGDTYAAVRDAKAVVEQMVKSPDTSEDILNKILDAPRLLERVAGVLLQNPMAVFGHEKDIVMMVLSN